MGSKSSKPEKSKHKPKKHTWVDPLSVPPNKRREVIFENYDKNQDGFLNVRDPDGLLSTLAHTWITAPPAEIHKIFGIEDAEKACYLSDEDLDCTIMLYTISKYPPANPKGLSFLEFKFLARKRIFQISLIGDPNVGKTTLFKMLGFKEQKHHPGRGGQMVDFGDLSMMLVACDLPKMVKHEEGRKLRVPPGMWEPTVFFIVYSISHPETWESIPQWIEQIRAHHDPERRWPLQAVLIGTKTGEKAERAVSKELVEEFAAQNPMIVGSYELTLILDKLFCYEQEEKAVAHLICEQGARMVMDPTRALADFTEQEIACLHEHINEEILTKQALKTYGNNLDDTDDETG